MKTIVRLGVLFFLLLLCHGNAKSDNDLANTIVGAWKSEKPLAGGKPRILFISPSTLTINREEPVAIILQYKSGLVTITDAATGGALCFVSDFTTTGIITRQSSASFDFPMSRRIYIKISREEAEKILSDR